MRQENGFDSERGHDNPGWLRDFGREYGDFSRPTMGGEGVDQQRGKLVTDKRARLCSVRIAPWYEVPEHWETIEPWISSALSHNALVYNAADIRELLLTRKMDLWLALSPQGLCASMVTQVCQLPRSRVLYVIALGGVDMKNWIHFEADLEAYGRANYCDVVEAAGREGWKRVLAKRGWAPATTIYRKQL